MGKTKPSKSLYDLEETRRGSTHVRSTSRTSKPETVLFTNRCFSGKGSSEHRRRHLFL